jgi:uncharacterized SAM-binding protein YcdF (DUF218 family)
MFTLQQQKMKKLRLRRYGWFILIGALLTMGLMFHEAGNWLVVRQQPIKSDVIIVLSGGEGRLEEGISLFEAGYGKYLMLSNFNEWTRGRSRSVMNVPVSAIIVEDKAYSTYTNALYTKELMQRYSFKSAIVVTSDFHSRRSKLIFDRVYRNTDITLHYTTAETRHFQPDRWWDNKHSRRTTYREYLKYVGYALFYWEQSFIRKSDVRICERPMQLRMGLLDFYFRSLSPSLPPLTFNPI